MKILIGLTIFMLVVKNALRIFSIDKSAVVVADDTDIALLLHHYWRDIL